MEGKGRERRGRGIGGAVSCAWPLLGGRGGYSFASYFGLAIGRTISSAKFLFGGGAICFLDTLVLSGWGSELECLSFDGGGGLGTMFGRFSVYG